MVNNIDFQLLAQSMSLSSLWSPTTVHCICKTSANVKYHNTKYHIMHARHFHKTKWTVEPDRATDSCAEFSTGCSLLLTPPSWFANTFNLQHLFHNLLAPLSIYCVNVMYIIRQTVLTYNKLPTNQHTNELNCWFRCGSSSVRRLQKNSIRFKSLEYFIKIYIIAVCAVRCHLLLHDIRK